MSKYATIRTVHVTQGFFSCRDCGDLFWHLVQYHPRCAKCHEAWKKVDTDPLNRQGKASDPQKTS